MAETASSLPMPPFLDVQRVPNLRDIGGYPISSPNAQAKSIRRNVVFRSADPSSGDHATLRSRLNITQAFDLRSSKEVDAAHFGAAMNFPGITRTWAPTNSEDMSPEALVLRYANYRSKGDEGFVRAYSEILSMAGPAVAKILTRLAEMYDAVVYGTGEKEAVLVHCTAGKDRTAIVTMILLLLAGCSTETVSREYALTEVGLATVRPILAERLLKRSETQTDEDKEAIDRMLGSRYEVMPKVVSLLDENWGGARAYVKKECNLADDVIDRVVGVLQTDESPIFDESGNLVANATGEKL